MQQQYGKTTAELETLVEGFCWVLSDYPMDSIIKAIGLHLKKSATIPTPADIENIINPPRPKPNWPVYVALKKKIHDGYYPLSDERQFMRECEEYAKENHAEQLEQYRDAQIQIERHKALAITSDYE